MSRLVLAGGLAATLGVIVSGCAHSRPNRVTVSANKPIQLASVPTDAMTDTDTNQRRDDAPEATTGNSRIRLASVNQDVEPAPAVAQSDGPEEASWGATGAVPTNGVLSLADLEVIAMQNNPTLSQAAAAVDQERGFYRQSGLYPNPQIGYLNSTANQSAPKQSNGVFLSQEFVTAKKLSLAQESASQEIKRLQWDQRAQEMRVLNDLKIRYYEVLGAQKAVEVAEQLEKLADESLTSAQALFDAKSVSRSDVLQATVLLERIPGDSSAKLGGLVE